MQPQTALIGSNGRVKLNAIAAVDLYFTLVIHPGNTEHNLAFRLCDTLQNTVLLILGIGLDHRLQGGEHLSGGLDEFRFVGILFLQKLKLRADIRHNRFPPSCKLNV